MADNTNPTAPFPTETEAPDAPFDTAKVHPVAPFAQTAVRRQQQASNVTNTTATIATNPSRVTVNTLPPGVGADPRAQHNQPSAPTPGVDPRAFRGMMGDQTAPAPDAPTAGRSALNRIGTVMSAFTMGANYSMREMAGDKGTNAQVKAIVSKGGLFGDVGQKIDALGNLLNYNSPGEAAFWTAQPGVHDAIMGARPKTPEGAAMQFLLGMHADFARWKQGHPIFTAGETFVGGLLDPTAWLTGMVATKVMGVGARAVGEFSDAAAAAARTKGAPVLGSAEHQTVTNGPGAAGQHGFSTTVTTPSAASRPQDVSAISKAGAAFGRTFSAQAKTFGPAFTKLHATLQDDMPIIGDRFAAARREYGSYGEWAHNKMVNDHSTVPVASATQMLSNDLFGGLSKDQKINMVHGVEDLPDIFAGKKNAPPDRAVPVQGVSIQQRAENWAEMQKNKLQRYETLMPKTFKLMTQPKQYGQYEEGIHDPFQGPRNPNQGVLESGERPSDAYGAAPHYDPTPGTTVTPLTVSDWFPRQGAWNRDGARPAAGATGQQGSFGLNIKRRTMGKLSDAMQPQVLKDFQGQPVGRMPGMQLDPKWDPAQAATRKDIQTENYAMMLQHVHDGKTLSSARTGLPATIPVEYNWPGGDVWKGASIEHNGVAHELSQGFNIGGGQMAADNAAQLADKIAPYWANKFNVNPSDARAAVLDRLSSAFQKKYPTHLVNAGQILRTPDLDGLAVEGTYLRMVGDSNPVLKWLGTSQSVQSRLRSEAGEFTHFQSSKAFPSGTVSGINPSDVQKTHFSGIEDDALPHAGLMRAYDTMTSLIRMGKLFNFTFHPIFNVHPALTNLMLEKAGMNPVKMAKYTATLDAAFLGAATTAGREAVTTARDLFKGGHLMGHEPQFGTKWDVPGDWMRAAERDGVTSKGSFGTGIPIDQYVHLFSSPWSELSLGEKAQRTIAAGSQWNQNLTFNVMEARLGAAAHHILTHDEGMTPHESARTINKYINDYSNLTNAERNPNLARVYWFYAFKKMQMRQAATSLLRKANVLGTESRVIQNWNQQQGDPQAGDHAIVVGRDSDGNPHLMSTSMAPYRFGEDVAGLSGLGGGREFGNAFWATAAGTLAPVPDAVARGFAQAYRMKTGASTTPKPWDPTTGFADVKQPIDVQIQQAMGIAGGEFAPVPMSPTPTTYTGLQPKQYGQLSAAAQNLRNVQRYMNPDLQRRTMALVQRLDNGDTTAVGEARDLYSAIERSRKGGF